MSTVVQRALDRIPSPVGLVVTGTEGKETVITVSWFSQISRQPPLLAISVSPETSVTPALATESTFVLALLGGNQEQVARICGHTRENVGDKVQESQLELGQSLQINTPSVTNALLNLECKVISHKIHGDHCLYVAEVLAAQIGSDMDQLVFADRDLIALTHEPNRPTH